MKELVAIGASLAAFAIAAWLLHRHANRGGDGGSSGYGDSWTADYTMLCQ